ncbi:MAG: DAK2 domain-containing protein [bacterium]|nr:DAK2 domain-containing protein [bacterium]
MIISGANHLYNNKQSVDELNVFPVPDGDTGTNMSLTSAAVALALKNNPTDSAAKAAELMKSAALRGARGNSGVILSQLFRGIAKSSAGLDELNAADFAKALKSGSEEAYKAVMKPTEGTILTVARESAEGAVQCRSNDITEVLRAAAERGNKALANTPKQLEELERAGVVDAGGQGWMYILEGALMYLETGRAAERADGDTQASQASPSAQGSVSTEDIKYKYCTEFLIEKENAGDTADSFRDAIAQKGDCMLVIDDGDIVKVHIHTNNPGYVLEEAVKLGELINLKIDNMKHQHRSILDASPKPVKVEVETKKRLKKPAAPDKDYGFVSVCTGKGIVKVLKDLGIDRIIEGGQTMNPSTEDILKAVDKVKAKTVFVFPNNKNIIMAANQAAELAEDKKVIVIPTKTLPQCVSAMMAFNANKDTDSNEKTMVRALGKVRTGQITYAVRDTEIEGVKIKKNDIISIIEGEISLVGHDINEVLDETVRELADEDSEYITVYTGREVKKAQLEAAEKLLSVYEEDEIEVVFRKGAQPLYYYIVGVE